MMPDDTRCGLDVSSLHRDTSMDISLSKNFRLLSCHRDTSSIVIFYLNLNTSLSSSGLFLLFISFHGISHLSCLSNS